MKKRITSIIAEGLHWPAEKQANLSQVIVAALGMALPVAVGALFGHVQIGSIAAFGGLALSNEGNSRKLGENIISIIYAVAAGITAFILGSFLSGNGIWPLILMPSIVLITSFIGGISRPLVRTTTMFILFFIIATRFGGKEIHPVAVAFFFAVGAIWTVLLSLVLRPALQEFIVREKTQAINQKQPPPRYTTKQYLNRWRKSLKSFTGWQYTLRITACIFIAELIKIIWPFQHGQWILLTVAIVVQRDISKLLPRSFQRGMGTLIGVVVSSIFIFSSRRCGYWFLLLAYWPPPA